MQINPFMNGSQAMMPFQQSNPLMMILGIIMQLLQSQMMAGGGQCGMPFSPSQNPNFGGGPSFGGGPNFGGGPSGDFLGGGTPSPFNPSGLSGPISGGGQGADAVNWALTQEGVSESANPNVVRGYSRGAWQAWCADFVSTAYERSGGSPWGHQSSVQGILDWGRNNAGHFMPANAARQNPGNLRVGDVVVWKQNGRSHVGLLTGVNRNGTFTTIEGNTSDRVARRTHSFSDSQLTGFVRGRGTF